MPDKNSRATARRALSVAGERIDPVQALVAAFDLDERTVARWEREAGRRPRLILAEGVMIAQVIKRYARRRVVGVVPG